MVQLMKNGESVPQAEKAAAPPVKMEVEDSLEEEHGPLHKRLKVLACFVTVISLITAVLIGIVTLFEV